MNYYTTVEYLWYFCTCCSPHLTSHYTDVGDKDNVTPLLYACNYGNKELVQYLVEELKCDVGEFVGVHIFYVIVIG